MKHLHDFPLFARAAHAHDPITSLEAERDVTRSGQRATHCAIMLHEVRRNPGQTASDYALTLGWDLQEARRRLTDLGPLHRGLVRQGEPALRKGRTHREMTWLPVEGRA